MAVDLWFGIALVASLLPVLINMARMVFQTADKRKRTLRDKASWTFVVVMMLVPWSLRTFYVAEDLRTRSEDDMVRKVFSTSIQGPTPYVSVARGYLSRMYNNYKALTRERRVKVVGFVDGIGLYKSFFGNARAPGNAMLATSMVNTTWWTDELRKLNCDFLEGGGTVRRVFLFGGDDERTKSIEEAHRQMSACAAVKRSPLELYLCDLRGLDDVSLRADVIDFIVNRGDKIAIEYKVSGGQLAEGSLVADEERIRELVGIHELLVSKSQAVPK